MIHSWKYHHLIINNLIIIFIFIEIRIKKYKNIYPNILGLKYVTSFSKVFKHLLKTIQRKEKKKFNLYKGTKMQK